ncbi:hypothetical protein BUY32_11800, partial [Staphylococcus cohnii]|uniref:hypothetical protein n=2 Tax=Staphylococcus TaxID=1279 RepID=UPI000EE97153
MVNILNTIANIFQNATQIEKIFIFIILVALVIFLIYIIYKLTFISPATRKSNFKENENANNGKIKISKFEYVWLTILLPICFI